MQNQCCCFFWLRFFWMVINLLHKKHHLEICLFSPTVLAYFEKSYIFAHFVCPFFIWMHKWRWSKHWIIVCIFAVAERVFDGSFVQNRFPASITALLWQANVQPKGDAAARARVARSTGFFIALLPPPPSALRLPPPSLSALGDDVLGCLLIMSRANISFSSYHLSVNQEDSPLSCLPSFSLSIYADYYQVMEICMYVYLSMSFLQNYGHEILHIGYTGPYETTYKHGKIWWFFSNFVTSR